MHDRWFSAAKQKRQPVKVGVSFFVQHFSDQWKKK
jgi:hypothetical protein